MQDRHFSCFTLLPPAPQLPYRLQVPSAALLLALRRCCEPFFSPPRVNRDDKAYIVDSALATAPRASS